AKLRAYYSYRDSIHAARDYDGFPTVLFVTTDPVAEERIADQACRALFIRGTEALPILSTTTARIREAPEGILGPIWRMPNGLASEKGAHLRAWPTNETFRGAVRGSPGLLVRRTRVVGFGTEPQLSSECKGRRNSAELMTFAREP